MPAGEHEIIMEFRPASVDATDTVAFFAIGCIKGALLLAIIIAFRRWRKKRKA